MRESKGVKKIDDILVGEKNLTNLWVARKKFKAFSRKISRFCPISWREGGQVRTILTNFLGGENIFLALNLDLNFQVDIMAIIKSYFTE